MTISNLIHEFCEHEIHFKGCSPASAQTAKCSISQFFRDLNLSSIDQVTPENTRHYFYMGRVKRNWSAATFRTHFMRLKVFFRYCIKRGLIAENPVLGIELPKLPRQLPKCLKKVEIDRLLEFVANYPYPSNFIRRRNEAIFATFLFTGVRRSELVNLHYTDLDFDRKVLLIRRGKGNKDRFIPLHPSLISKLRRYLEERHKLRKTCPELFTSAKRNTGFTIYGLKHMVDRLKIESGINFSLHKLRHSFARLMLEGGCDIYSLSKMMGHSDIKTTAIYLFASDEHLKEQMSKHPLANIESARWDF